MPRRFFYRYIDIAFFMNMTDNDFYKMYSVGYIEKSDSFRREEQVWQTEKIYVDYWQRTFLQW